MYIFNTQFSPPDQRDIPFVPTVEPANFKPFVDLRPEIEEVEDQLTIGSCVANGIVTQCEYLVKKGGSQADLSRMFLYTATLNFENRLGQEGLVVRDAYKVAYKYGIPPEEGPNGYPYDLSKSAVNPPPYVYNTASKTRVMRYEAVVSPVLSSMLYEKQEKIDRILAALNMGLTVGVAFMVTQSIQFMAGDWREQKYSLLGSGSVEAGGHYMEIIGYDLSKGKFLIQNSWGKKWGDGGFGGFPFDIVDEPFFEAWVIRDFNGFKVSETPGIKFEGLNRYRIDARIVPEPSEIGKKVKIWMGAHLPDGRIFLRAPIQPSQVGPGPQGVIYGTDNWYPVSSDRNMTPTVQDYTLGETNHVVVVQWMNMQDVPAGTIVYLAYGNEEHTDWKIKQICKTPLF